MSPVDWQDARDNLRIGTGVGTVFVASFCAVVLGLASIIAIPLVMLGGAILFGSGKGKPKNGAKP